MSNVKRKIAAGTAGLALLAAGGGAYAATRDNGAAQRQAFLDDAAKRLGVTTQQLTDALKGAANDRLDAAVKAGKLTQQQADQIKQRITQGGGLPFLGFRHPGFGPRRAFGPFVGGLDAAAKYLGLSDAQLRDKLFAGKSLADVANDEGKSVDGLKTAMLDDLKAKLDGDPNLSADQRQRILTKLNARIDALVNRTPPARAARPWP